MAPEEERTRLIGELASLLREDSLPDDARAAGLTLIGWLARRMPGEGPSQAGVAEMTGHGGKSNGANGTADLRQRS